MMTITQAIAAHGATPVYLAACARMRGDMQPLDALGLPGATLGDAWRITCQAHRAMDDAERVAEQVASDVEMICTAERVRL